MKNLLTCVALLAAIPLLHRELPRRTFGGITPSSAAKTPGNLIIVTLDGFRWQELFAGADENLLKDPSCTVDTALARTRFWSENERERRQKLMPFFWDVLAQKGQLYGNRQFGNKVNTANIYSFSYPGYNEIFSGNTDLRVSSNKKKWNTNRNVLEYINSKGTFSGKVVAFTSWDVFPYILNERRSGMMVNSGFEDLPGEERSDTISLINRVQQRAFAGRGGSRFDQLTMLAAREYMRLHKPRIIFIGLGETDEHAHQGRYDLYLQQAQQTDQMLADLWYWVQTTPGYRDNTSLLVTTDHGRGKMDKSWASHSVFIRGASQTWLALMGPSMAPLGEIRKEQQLYQQDVAALIAGLLGEEFGGLTRNPGRDER